jgi:hypothetical protein
MPTPHQGQEAAEAPTIEDGDKRGAMACLDEEKDEVRGEVRVEGDKNGAAGGLQEVEELD